MTPRAAYRPDGRATAGLLAALGDAAAGTSLPPSLRGEGGAPPQTWGELLFEGDGLASETEPSQALLRALARLHACLVDHLDLLPDLARGWLMSERLGVPRLPPIPDRAVVVVDGDPKRAPAVLPKGSLLKAGKGPLGERLYSTVESLTVLGAPVLGGHSHRVLSSGSDVAAWRRAGLSDGSIAPFAPFGAVDDPAAPHQLYVTSDLLQFTRGTLTASVRFEDVKVGGVTPPSMAGVATVLKALDWELSTADGGTWHVTPSGGPTSPGNSITLNFSLTGGSAPQMVEGTPQTFLRASFPEPGTAGFDRAAALGFSFRTAHLLAVGSDVSPDAGYAGDGLLDVTKEFEPFGPVPRRGDSFFLRLDEAFGKPLKHVIVSLDLLTPERTFKAAQYGLSQATQWVNYANYLMDEEGVGYELDKNQFGTPDFAVRWERFDGTQWTYFKEQTGDFGGVERAFEGNVPSPFSARTSVGGAEGHFVRAFLFHGDFGWDDFQKTMAENARKVAAGDGETVVAAIPPDPPVVSRVRITYYTAEDSNAGKVGLYVRNALSSVARLSPAGSGGALHPFSQNDEGFDGSFYLGVGEPLPLGEVVSVYARVDEADACAAVQGDTAVVWQYRSEDDGWRDLPCVDGTLGLRQSGVLRFPAPLDWNSGAPEADEAGGHWVRARTHAPAAAGRIRLLRTDAVEAAYRFVPGHETDDPTPSTPIEAGAITALRAPVLGIKKVGNPARSWGGRGPEPDASFFARSGGVLRHRNRAVTPWDVEQLVATEFAELALVRCLPHHSPSGGEEAECAAGWLAVVPVPSSVERTPVPSVRLAAAIEEFVLEHGAVDLSVAVLCPLYAEVGVRATIRLVRGIPAATAREELDAGLRRFLHPLSQTRAGGFGESLYRSSVVRFLEEQATVDHVSDLDFLAPHTGLERVDVDACRGLIASAAVHELFTEAVL